MRRAPRVQHAPGVRQDLHQLAGTAGVIEVDVGEEQVVHLVPGDAELVERGQQPRRGWGGAGVHEGGATLVHHEVARREPGPHVKRVDQVDAVAQGLGQRHSPLHLPYRRISSVEHRLGRWLE